MPTDKQIEANRLDVPECASPQTSEGQAKSGRNAVRHDFCARTVVLPNENREEFDQLCDALEAEWQPETATERFLVIQMATSQWRLGRSQLAEAQLLGAGPENSGPRAYENLIRHQNSLLRTYFKSLKELQQLRKSRLADAQAAAPAKTAKRTHTDPPASPEDAHAFWPGIHVETLRVAREALRRRALEMRNLTSENEPDLTSGDDDSEPDSPELAA
ncbi:MAG: hypothetical protein U0Q18_03755 [Bryobacteraceae bacterium]